MKKAISDIRNSQLSTLTQKLISVDFNDNLINAIDKKTAHLTKYIFSQESKPHRAFSLFLFDKNYNLLLQKRSEYKLIFPLQWANTCCSHQLFHMNENDAIMKYQRSQEYVIQRLQFEMNININKIPLHLVQKIIYSANGGEQYSEYELDYIYFAQIEQDRPTITPNLEEVDDSKWLNQQEFLQFKQTNQHQFTPWFNLICQHNLLNWWKQFQRKEYDFMNPERIDQLN